MDNKLSKQTTIAIYSPEPIVIHNADVLGVDFGKINDCPKSWSP